MCWGCQLQVGLLMDNKYTSEYLVYCVAIINIRGMELPNFFLFYTFSAL